ncbi:MAG: class I SAM-dependent methyltransferase [Ectothiorhodospiraceae bacterium]|nr:class I SAM-dependent methyltransferase [Ectothiorhodospiraceae bacterium]
MSDCTVRYEHDALRPAAETLAIRLRLPLRSKEDAPPGLALLLTAEGLELRDIGQPRGDGIMVDFVSSQRLRQASGASEGLIRAVGARRGQRPDVLDATAGLGRDGAMLAWRGCRVTLVERSPVLAAMLEDGLARAATRAATAGMASRLRLVSADSVTFMRALDADERPKVVYLDPMYPEKGRKAKSRKDMQLLQQLLGEDPEPPDLLEAALATAHNRVVVKRPRKAPALQGLAPSHQIIGRSTRFDVYLIQPARDR